MIRLVVSDIDGTLVPDGSDKINPEIFDVIRQLNKKGVIFAAASGRQFHSIKQLFAPVCEEILYITDNGGFLRDYNSIFNVNSIDKDMISKMVSDAKMLKDCEYMLCGRIDAYAETEGTPMYNWLKDSYKYSIITVDDLAKPIDDDIVKLSIYHPSDAESICMKYFEPKWHGRLNMACAGENWFDCMSLAAGKGNCLKYLQSRLNITADETMAFGDNINDLDMIKNATHSYAIGNARQEVKDCAKYIADTNVNDGVLKELKKLLASL